MLVEAIEFAAKAHRGQFRKYKDRFGLTEPFIMHPARVAAMVAHARIKFPHNSFEDILAAAWCHDVLEDCPSVSYDEIVNTTSPACAVLVQELTRPSSVYAIKIPRAARKIMDNENLMNASREAKLIKAFDRMDNIQGLINAPKDFALLYLKESEALAEVLRDADRDTFNALAFTINAATKYFEERVRTH
jgi:(p)ppGpp synthase/HD superfamily hydrolase